VEVIEDDCLQVLVTACFYCQGSLTSSTSVPPKSDCRLLTNPYCLCRAGLCTAHEGSWHWYQQGEQCW
jgi:hypothetical protein